jgi:hypothetical protein
LKQDHSAGMRTNRQSGLRGAATPATALVWSGTRRRDIGNLAKENEFRLGPGLGGHCHH